MSPEVPESSTGLPPRLAAVLAYGGWWVTGLIFWVVERRNRFVRFHAAQSIAAFGLTGVIMAAAVVAGLLAGVLFIWYRTRRPATTIEARNHEHNFFRAH